MVAVIDQTNHDCSLRRARKWTVVSKWAAGTVVLVSFMVLNVAGKFTVIVGNPFERGYFHHGWPLVFMHSDPDYFLDGIMWSDMRIDTRLGDTFTFQTSFPSALFRVKSNRILTFSTGRLALNVLLCVLLVSGTILGARHWRSSRIGQVSLFQILACVGFVGVFVDAFQQGWAWENVPVTIVLLSVVATTLTILARVTSLLVESNGVAEACHPPTMRSSDTTQ